MSIRMSSNYSIKSIEISGVGRKFFWEGPKSKNMEKKKILLFAKTAQIALWFHQKIFSGFFRAGRGGGGAELIEMIFTVISKPAKFIRGV